MSQITTFQVATYQGERLRALAKLNGKTATSMLAALIDDAAASAGLDVTSNAVRVQPYQDHFIADLFGTYRVELARAGIESLADNLTTIADKGGTAFNLDHDFEVYRQGSGVVLRIDAVEMKSGTLGGRKLSLKKSMSPDVAREIARGLLAGLPAEAV